LAAATANPTDWPLPMMSLTPEDWMEISQPPT